MFNILRTKALERGYAFNLTYEQFVGFTLESWRHYCHTQIDWSKSHRYNLDRVDNSEGYSVENCVVCCKCCNYGKSFGFTYAEWWAMTEVFRRPKWKNLSQRTSRP